MKLKNLPGILCGILVSAIALPTLANPPGDPSKLAAANTAFALDLLKQVAQEQPGRNIFLSPYSVSSVLQMVANGAAGPTRAEMERALHVDGLKPELVNVGYKALDQTIKKEKDAVLNIANSIWYRQGTQLKPEFISCNKTFYGAAAEALDFNSPKAAGVINAWADRKTAGRIKEIISGPIAGDTEVFLLNAVYFKGKWTAPFEKRQTEQLPFKLRDGRMKPARIMHKFGHFEYEEGNDYQVVRLPYKGENLGMYVFLPATNSSPEKLLASPKSDSWDNTLTQPLDKRRGMVGLPRFRLECETPLNEPLKGLGIRLAFGRGTDFSALSPRPLYLSEVLQKSFVEVNEEGTEAAAVTRGGLTPLSAPPVDEPFQMIVDRPFLFLIVDRAANTILFMGLVQEPITAR